MKLEGIPVRILEEKIFLIQREIWEQQVYGNWLSFLLDGNEREIPEPPQEEETREVSLSQVLSSLVEVESEETLADVLDAPLVKIPQFDPFEVISELSKILSEFISENNFLSLLVSEIPKPSWYKTFAEYKKR
ncbi:hypothetical protein A9K97_gp386 [Tokyovirus A1]|uniref:hypothetical protein n=1 Tax=Tokyovirus A1 TaxID=1826170 RepID=UPI0007A97828|nr:hypothetical protein A9K97_gp386 [Tokyovirus A1]BAU79965.1 conserved hypothetical protein [Tokyovirus A1]